MFKLVKYNDKLPQIIIFDAKDFKASDFNLEEIKDITLDELKSEYVFTPIMSLNDLLLRVLRPKERTVSHVLSECGIECFAALDVEQTKVNLKASKLSSNHRKLVVDRYNYILSLTNGDTISQDSVNNE